MKAHKGDSSIVDNGDDHQLSHNNDDEDFDASVREHIHRKKLEF